MNSYILFHSRGKSEDSKYLSNFTAVENGLCIEESYIVRNVTNHSIEKTILRDMK